MRKDINNGTASWHTSGNGPAVVLIHGFAENSRLWDQQAKHLSGNFTVIVPDLPGCGEAPLQEPLSMESMADYVQGILAEEKISSAVIIGHSMGGYVALALAEKYPALVKGLGLFHSTATADSEEKKEGRRKSIRLMQEYGADNFVRQTLPNMFSTASKSRSPEKIEAYVQMGMECPVSTMQASYEAMMQRPDRTAILRNIAAPVFFVIGKEDNAVPPDVVLPQITLPRISSIHIFEDVGHMGMWEIPEESNMALQQFVTFCQL